MSGCLVHASQSCRIFLPTGLCAGIVCRHSPQIGLELSGKVSAAREGVTDVVPGDAVFSPVEFVSPTSAGALDLAIRQR